MDLRSRIMTRSGSTENLLAYALGRVLDYRDMPVVRGIDREAARNNNRFSSFVLGVVKSVAFQMRRSEEAEPAGATLGAGVPAAGGER